MNKKETFWQFMLHSLELKIEDFINQKQVLENFPTFFKKLNSIDENSDPAFDYSYKKLEEYIEVLELGKMKETLKEIEIFYNDFLFNFGIEHEKKKSY